MGDERFAEPFERFLEAVPDGVVIARPDGRIVYANRQAEQLSGYTREELAGSPIERLVPARLRARHRRYLTGYFRSSPGVRPMGANLDIRLRRKDGTEFPADIALSQVRTAEGVLAVAAVRDITERVRVEQELLQAQERFRLMVDEVTDYAIFMLDPKGRVSTWNQGAERIKGYTQAEILGRPFSVFYPPEDLEAGKPERVLAGATAQGRGEDEGWRVRKDGSRFWASVVTTALHDVTGKLRGFSKVIRDITEHREAQAQLAAALQVTQATLQESEPDDILRLVARCARELVQADLAAVAPLDPGGRFFTIRVAEGLFADEAVGIQVAVGAAILGEVVESRRSRRFEPVSDDSGAAPSLAARLGPTLMVPLTAHDRTIGALTVANRAAGRAFGDHDPRLLDLFAAQAAVAIDYTRVRDELRRLAVLEDRERIGRELHDGVIQLLFAVGMELQAAAALAGDAQLGGRLEAAVGQIDQAIRDVRNYIFGLRPGVLASSRLDAALKELARDLEDRHGVAAVVDVDADVAVRLADRASDLIQLTREALSNVGRHAKASTCRVTLKSVDGEAVLAIEDNGCGFDAGRRKGVGWGLRNLEDRVADLGGRLRIESTPGEGTTVTASVPL